MEREFQAFSDVKDLQQNFNEIRIIRNTVMHNKTINLTVACAVAVEEASK